jgi:peptidoglycan/xylan/chitin deacetylase (PgdA/CDA1 family)
VRLSGFERLVLCYHSVSDEWSHQLAVRRRSFERQLSSLLRRGFRPISATELAGGARRGLHVTFDDAYRDVLDVGPVLERLGVHATVFAAASFARDGRPLDVPELAAEAIAHPQRLATMNWDELRELARRGVEIGSHTVTHPHLTRLSDAEIERELADSRAEIEDELGRPCMLLAYPYGEHDARVQAIARRCNYEAAFALWEGSEPTDRYALPRVDIYRRDSLLRATLKTSFLKPSASALLARARARSASRTSSPSPP